MAQKLLQAWKKTEFRAAQQQLSYHMAQKIPEGGKKKSQGLPASTVKYVGASTALQVIP